MRSITHKHVGRRTKRDEFLSDKSWDVLLEGAPPPRDPRCSPPLAALAEKYDDPDNVDRIQRAITKCNVVKEEITSTFEEGTFW